MSTKFYLTVIALVLCLMFAGFAHGQWQPRSQQFTTMSFKDNSVGYAGQSNVLSKTIDGGLNWTTLKNLPVSNIIKIQVVNTNIFVLADSGLNSKFFKIVDTTAYLLFNCEGEPKNLYFKNISEGYIIINSNTYRTTNSGSNWLLLNETEFTKIISNSTRLYGIKNDQNIYWSTNSGNNWTSINFPVVITGIVMKDSIGYCVANQYYVYRTTDNWDTRDSISNSENNPIRLFDVTFINNISIGISYYIGTQNKIKFLKFDGSWENTNFPDSDTNHQYYFATITGRIFAHSRMDSLYLKDTSIILTNITSPVVKSYSLFTNYPNPFNSQTTIKYSVQKKDNVKIDLFDISGKYISTIVNQLQNPGTYTANVNMNTLSSGIYFAKYNDLVIKLTLVK